MPIELVLFLTFCLFVLAALFIEPVRKMVAVTVVLSMVFSIGWYCATGSFSFPLQFGMQPSVTQASAPPSWGGQ